jgi:selenide,water dikinase
MCQMNLAGAAFANIDGVKAMTDVTGFGLLGHLSEVSGRGVQAQVWYQDVPKLPGVESMRLARCRAAPSATFASYGHLMGEMPDAVARSAVRSANLRRSAAGGDAGSRSRGSGLPASSALP